MPPVRKWDLPGASYLPQGRKGQGLGSRPPSELSRSIIIRYPHADTVGFPVDPSSLRVLRRSRAEATGLPCSHPAVRTARQNPTRR